MRDGSGCTQSPDFGPENFPAAYKFFIKKRPGRPFRQQKQASLTRLFFLDFRLFSREELFEGLVGRNLAEDR